MLEVMKMKKNWLALGTSALLLFTLAGCGNSDQKDTSDNSNNAKEEEKADQKEQEKELKEDKEKEKKDEDDGGALETKKFDVSMEQAVKDFQKNNPKAKLVEVSLSHSDVDDYHYRVYGVEGKDVYREKVNANTGRADNTFHMPMLTKDQNELPKETFTLDGVKSPKEAIKAAMTALIDKEGLKKDAKDVHVAEWELVKENGTVVYKMRIRHILREYHVTLDAQNLNVISTEKDLY